MYLLHADTTFGTVRYRGDTYGLLGGFHFGIALEKEIIEAKRRDRSRYAVLFPPRIGTKATWRIDEERRLWLEEIRVATYDASQELIHLPDHPYPIAGTWVNAMRLLLSEAIVSPYKTGTVIAQLEVLTLWFEKGKVAKTMRTTEEVDTVRLGNYVNNAS